MKKTISFFFGCFLFLISSVFSEEVFKFSFNNVEYLHRWSENGQHEFTPAEQADLSKWDDMITINIYETVNNGEQLATLANQILNNYQTYCESYIGNIIKTDSKPRTEESFTEHLIIVALGDVNFFELVFARFLLFEDIGYVIIYSHRFYNGNVDELYTWFDNNGLQIENDLMSLKSIPTLFELNKLQQSD